MDVLLVALLMLVVGLLLGYRLGKSRVYCEAAEAFDEGGTHLTEFRTKSWARRG